jgi:hypothetical protein
MDLTDVDVATMRAQAEPAAPAIKEAPMIGGTGVSLWEPRLNMALVSDDGSAVDALTSEDLASPPWKDKQCK